MTGIDDLIICPRCLRPMGDDITATTCQYCGYKEGDIMKEDEQLKEEMKKRLKEYPVLREYLRKGVEEFGLTEDEAAEIMIAAYFSTKKMI